MWAATAVTPLPAFYWWYGIGRTRTHSDSSVAVPAAGRNRVLLERMRSVSSEVSVMPWPTAQSTSILRRTLPIVFTPSAHTSVQNRPESNKSEQPNLKKPDKICAKLAQIDHPERTIARNSLEIRAVRHGKKKFAPNSRTSEILFAPKRPWRATAQHNEIPNRREPVLDLTASGCECADEQRSRYTQCSANVQPMRQLISCGARSTLVAHRPRTVMT